MKQKTPKFLKRILAPNKALTLEAQLVQTQIENSLQNSTDNLVYSALIKFSLIQYLNPFLIKVNEVGCSVRYQGPHSGQILLEIEWQR